MSASTRARTVYSCSAISLPSGSQQLSRKNASTTSSVPSGTTSTRRCRRMHTTGRSGNSCHAERVVAGHEPARVAHRVQVGAAVGDRELRGTPGTQPRADDAPFAHAELVRALGPQLRRAVAGPGEAGDQAGAGDVVEQQVEGRGGLALAGQHAVDGGPQVAAALGADQALDARALGYDLDRLDPPVGRDDGEHLRLRHHDRVAGPGGHEVTGASDQVDGGAEAARPHHVDRRRAAHRSRLPRRGAGLGVVERFRQGSGRVHLGVGHRPSLRSTRFRRPARARDGPEHRTGRSTGDELATVGSIRVTTERGAAHRERRHRRLLPHAGAHVRGGPRRIARGSRARFPRARRGRRRISSRTW